MKACFAFLLVFVLFSHPAQAFGGLREKIKERIQDHMRAKLESLPAPEVNASVQDTITTAGDYFFSIPHDGITRMYRVHVPPRYQPDVPTPLLFAFHGGGGGMNYQAKDENY